MFTKKHYKAIAAMILRRFGVNESWRKETKTDWAIRLFVGELEDYFADDNPNFNREQFRTACGF